MRRVLLKLRCRRKDKDCCGGRRPRIKYAVLAVELVENQWMLVKASSMYSNDLEAARKEGLLDGSVVSLGLHEDKGFLDQLREAGVLTERCEVAP